VCRDVGTCTLNQCNLVKMLRTEIIPHSSLRMFLGFKVDVRSSDMFRKESASRMFRRRKYCFLTGLLMRDTDQWTLIVGA
jgi:hypothetical protein